MVPAIAVVKLPDAIDFATGAAMLLKGLTVQRLLRRTRIELAPGDPPPVAVPLIRVRACSGLSVRSGA